MARTMLVAGLLLSLLSRPVLAHGGHDDAFKGDQSAPTTTQVNVLPEVQRAMGLVVGSVEEKVLNLGFAVNGRIEALPERTAEINAPVAGRVLRLTASRGQSVHRGQTLVVLDSPEIRQLAVEAQRNQVQARAALHQAQTQLQLAESTYQREKELLSLRISARKDFQVAQAERDRAGADLEAARAQVQLANASLTSRLAQLGQRGVNARADGSLTLSSPIAGIVADQQVSAAEAVEPGKVLYRVVNLAAVWATAQVYEKDLSKIRVGQPLEVVSESYPGRTFRGRISSIDPLVDPQTRTVGVRAVLPNPQALLKPEMFATLRVVTGSKTGPVTVIPGSAVLDVEGEKLVYVQNGNGFVPTPVKLGQTSGDLVEIKDGVFPGDLVVTRRVFQLHAQSLKGDFAAEDSASGTVKADKALPGRGKPSELASGNPNTLPGWFWPLGALVLTMGGFLAGIWVAKKSTADTRVPGKDLSARPDSDTRTGRKGVS